ncbi:MAG: amino acid permease, partial [Lysobacteraceae bacterium]
MPKPFTRLDAGRCEGNLRGGRKGRLVAAFALAYSLYALVGTGAESLAWG